LLHKRKSLLIILSVVGVCLLLFSQCMQSGTVQTPPTADKRKVQASQGGGAKKLTADIVMRATVSAGEKQFALLQNANEQFMRSHEGVTVQLENIPVQGAYAAFKKAGQLGDSGDILLLDNMWVSEFAALGFLIPVDEFGLGDLQSERIAALMNQMKWNGYLWGLPANADPLILAWNRNAVTGKFDRAPGNAADMIEWNKALMKPQEGLYGIYTDPSDPAYFAALTSALTDTAAENENPLVKLADPNLQKTLQAFLIPQEQTWSSKSFKANYPLPSQVWDPWKALLEGKMAAMVTTVSEFTQHGSGNLAIAALPVRFTGSVSGAWLKGSSFCVSSRTLNKTAAIEWIKAMTSASMQEEQWKEAGLLPALMAPYNSSLLRADPLYNSYAWLIEHGRTWPRQIDAAVKLEGLRAGLLQLHAGMTDLKTLADRTAKQWTQEKTAAGR
jgi:maltose-binding protein MalE